MKIETREVVILGAGPSGLGAGYEINKHHGKVKLYDVHSQVGGLARSITYKGNLFDVGPHRFYTKEQAIIDLWDETLGPDFLHVPRLTRIYYRNRFFEYPIKTFNVLRNLGPIDTFLMIWSYMLVRLFPSKQEPVTFEDWVTQKFGKKLYETFFKTYTEKLWGVPCNQIAAKWAAQRIKGLDLREVIANAFSLRAKKKARSLIDSFRYPKKGAGMMYEVMADKLKAKGHSIDLAHRCVKIRHHNNKITEVVFETPKGDKVVKTPALFSSIPITEFIQILDPAPPPAIIKASKELRYRDHITVNLLVKGGHPFPDNWIYIHSPEVKMVRLSNYNTFSDAMTVDPDVVALSCEYFCFREEAIWQQPDQELIVLATDELEQLRLVHREDVIDGFIIRELDSYPLYYIGYQEPFDKMKAYVSQFENLSLIGRAGMFKYNNMDHALLSGIYAARNLFGQQYDVWEVGEEKDYLEQAKE